MRILSGRAAEAEIERLAVRSQQFAALEPPVRRIVNDIRRNGDGALRRHAAKWDGLGKSQSLRVTGKEMEEAWKSLNPRLRESLQQAAGNIRCFCEWQLPRSWKRTTKGISLGQTVQPLESVGCYVPGGRYPLVSTVLMTVIPAQVAGVKNIRVVSPNPSAEVLALLAKLGSCFDTASVAEIELQPWHTEHEAFLAWTRSSGRGMPTLRWQKCWSHSIVRLTFSPDRPRR